MGRLVPTPLLLAGLLPGLLLQACGTARSPSAHADAGYAALAAGDRAEAADEFELALAALEPDLGDPLYRRVRLGALEARALDHPEPAVAEFLTLVAASDGAIGARDVGRLAYALDAHGSRDHARALVRKARELLPDDASLPGLEALLEAPPEDAARAEELGKLGGLGYGGGD